MFCRSVDMLFPLYPPPLREQCQNGALCFSTERHGCCSSKWSGPWMLMLEQCRPVWRRTTTSHKSIEIIKTLHAPIKLLTDYEEEEKTFFLTRSIWFQRRLFVNGPLRHLNIVFLKCFSSNWARNINLSLPWLTVSYSGCSLCVILPGCDA